MTVEKEKIRTPKYHENTENHFGVGIDYPEKSKTFSGRMEICARLAGNATILADQAGISRRAIGTYLSGESEPTRERLVAIADAVGVSVQWLATGKGPMRSGERPAEAVADRIYVPIPRYSKDVEGREVEVESEIASLALSRKWLESKGLNPVDLVYVRMPDDSMQPTIRAGGLVVIDASTDKLRGDGIYALMYLGAIAVKRLQVDFGGGLWVRGDNTAYREQHLSAEEAGRLHVVGRVIWAGGEV